MTRQLALLACLVLVFGAGCDAPNSPNLQSPVQVSSAQAPMTWVSLAPGMDRLDDQFATDTDSVVTIYRLDPQKYRFQFEQQSTPETVSEWMSHLPNAMLVVNGVYFKEDEQPAGFLATTATRIGKSQFDWDKSGTILFGDHVQIVDTSGQKLDLAHLRNAAQSYPILIEKGKPALQKGSELVARRTFMGLDTSGLVYVGVIPHAAVTLFQLMGILQQTRISWDSAINLDGGPSSGIVARDSAGLEVTDSLTPVPNAIVVEPVK